MIIFILEQYIIIILKTAHTFKYINHTNHSSTSKCSYFLLSFSVELSSFSDCLSRSISAANLSTLPDQFSLVFFFCDVSFICCVICSRWSRSLNETWPDPLLAGCCWQNKIYYSKWIKKTIQKHINKLFKRAQKNYIPESHLQFINDFMNFQ